MTASTSNERTHPVLVALADTVRRFDIEQQPFLDLIDANLQDQRVAPYEDWAALRGYCELSAAPVGRMVLRVFRIGPAAAVGLSDDVCIGLQLANFAQDVSVDARLGRTYLLQCELREHGVEGATRLLCERARTLLASGRELETLAPARLRVQLSLYRLGGEAILDAVAATGYRTATHRPAVDRPARVRIAAGALAASWRRGGRAGGPLGSVRTRPESGVLDAPAAPDLRALERFCEDMARREAANFYWGFIALPRQQRTAIYALYDFARQVDDDADLDGRASREARLDHHRRRLRETRPGDTTDPVMGLLAVAMRRYSIPLEELDMLIDGVAMDLTTTRYRTWEELRSYANLVASVVGRMCVRIFGFRDPIALERADELGVALQLINILRDVHEDAARGRIYLPADEMAEYGITERHPRGPGGARLAELHGDAGRSRTAAARVGAARHRVDPDPASGLRAHHGGHLPRDPRPHRGDAGAATHRPRPALQGGEARGHGALVAGRRMKREPRVAVVGAGLAGLTAGLDLARRGWHVDLYERSRLLGGKATSFVVDGNEVDCGQHVVLACCTATLDLVEELGMSDDLHVQPRFEATVLSRTARPRRCARRNSRLPCIS